MHKKPERREEENLKFNAFLLLQEWLLPAETTGAYLHSYHIKYVHNLTNDL